MAAVTSCCFFVLGTVSMSATSSTKSSCRAKSGCIALPLWAPSSRPFHTGCLSMYQLGRYPPHLMKHLHLRFSQLVCMA